jgi:peptidoglycan/LPS O-acetylase OafA/YrhL
MMTGAAPTNTPPPQDRLVVLDLMRGVAAIAVLIYHAEIFLGVQFLPNAYLAVDLFFLLSGFVIAHNYDHKFTAGMSLRDFTVQRLIRLYPCFILTLGIGFVLGSARMTRDMGYFDGWRILGTGALNALFIPSYVFPYHVHVETFPFNGAQWSLTFELFANWLYWVLFPHLSSRRLILLIAAAAILEVTATFLLGSLDVGMRPGDFWLGVPRVILPFFTGVALRRFVFDRVSIRLGTAGIGGVVIALLVVFSLGDLVGPEFLPALEFMSVAVLFPALLIAACRTTPSPWVRRICEFTGNASYPVYLLQGPFFFFFAALPELTLHIKAKDLIPYVGIAHVVCTLLCAAWVDRYYELPIRNWLKRRWRGRVQVATPRTSFG